MKEILFLVFIKRKNRIHSVQRDEVPEILVFTNNYWVRWVGQSNFEWKSIVYNVNSFSSLIHV